MVLLLLNRPLKGWRWGLRLNRCFFWFGNLRRALYLSSCRSECRLGSCFLSLQPVQTLFDALFLSRAIPPRLIVPHRSTDNNVVLVLWVGLNDDLRAAG